MARSARPPWGPNNLRPLPAIGDRVKLDYGPNGNTWKRAGEVRGIVDGHIVVRRWLVTKAYHKYEIIEPISWSWQRYVHLPAKGEPIPHNETLDWNEAADG